MLTSNVCVAVASELAESAVIVNIPVVPAKASAGIVMATSKLYEPCQPS